MSSKSSLPDQLQRNLARSFIVEKANDPSFLDIVELISDVASDVTDTMTEAEVDEFADQVYDLITKAKVIVKFYDER